MNIFNTLIPTYTMKNGWDQSGATTLWVTLISSISSLGVTFGSFLSKDLMKLAKLKALHITNMILLVSYSISFIDNIPVLILCRFFEGLVTGGFACSSIP